MLLIGAAPNAIAYESKQFTTGEFFGYGITKRNLDSHLGIALLVILAALGYADID